MTTRIEDYGLVGDLQTAALVSRSGAMDWLCFPRFDSGAVFASLLGDGENGHWTIQPAGASPPGSLDASLLLIPLVGFLSADDERVIGTVRAIERELLREGLVERYRADDENIGIDGLPPGEGVFLPRSFGLAAVHAQQGRRREAVELFERLLSLRNDLGLLSEEYDPARGRLVGNFPQAFTHIGLVETAFTLSRGAGRAQATA